VQPTANRAVPKRAHKTQNAAKLLEEKRDRELGETQSKEAQEETDEEREERERKEKAERVKRMAASSGMGGMGGMGMMAMGNIAAAAAQRGTTAHPSNAWHTALTAHTCVGRGGKAGGGRGRGGK
jgi:hypothetical protein